MSNGTLKVTVRAHWVNACILLWAARPYVLVDGTEYSAEWSQPLTITVPPGPHRVVTYIRYKNTTSDLGKGDLEVTVEPGQAVSITSRNGWMNHTPFRPQIAA